MLSPFLISAPSQATGMGRPRLGHVDRSARSHRPFRFLPNKAYLFVSKYSYVTLSRYVILFSYQNDPLFAALQPSVN